MITPMTKAEQGELIDYARRFGFSVGNRHPRFTDDVVSASLLGAAIAFDSPDFPEDIEGRRKFLGQTCWNMMRREMTWFTRRSSRSSSPTSASQGRANRTRSWTPTTTRRSPTGLTSSSSWPLSSWG